MIVAVSSFLFICHHTSVLSQLILVISGIMLISITDVNRLNSLLTALSNKSMLCFS